MRYRSFHESLTNAVLTTPGATPESLRRAVLERAQAIHAKDGVPPALIPYVDTVARHAYTVTDADVTTLQHAGNSDDALFEITVAAAVGAALHRLDRGMAALRGSGGEPD
jgi:alkylhydroperoxidase family enzyme